MGDRSKRRFAMAARMALKRAVARTKQVLLTDPGTAPDAGESAAQKEMAESAARLRGGVAKVAQLAGYVSTPETDDAREALAALWDSVPPMDINQVHAVIEADLGRPVSEVFAAFEPTPIASASIGQVHAAVDDRGRELAVKVQYPDIAEAVRADLASSRLVRQLAGDAIGRGLDADALDRLRKAVLDELDYVAEADALDRFHSAWADTDTIVIPEVDRTRSSTRVLTMTRLRGTPLLSPTARSLDVDAIGEALLRFGWGSPLAHGLVQADPNPGNYLVLDADPVRVGFLDFGCTDVVEQAVLDGERELWRALLHHDPILGAERFRVALRSLELVPTPRAFHSDLYRRWEGTLAAPFIGDAFTWTADHARTFAALSQQMVAAGKLRLPGATALLWRQRVGLAAVLGSLGATTPARSILTALV